MKNEMRECNSSRGLKRAPTGMCRTICRMTCKVGVVLHSSSVDDVSTKIMLRDSHIEIKPRRNGIE